MSTKCVGNCDVQEGGSSEKMKRSCDDVPDFKPRCFAVVVAVVPGNA